MPTESPSSSWAFLVIREKIISSSTSKLINKKEVDSGLMLITLDFV